MFINFCSYDDKKSSKMNGVKDERTDAFQNSSVDSFGEQDPFSNQAKDAFGATSSDPFGSSFPSQAAVNNCLMIKKYFFIE